jgi:hypothetical protein
VRVSKTAATSARRQPSIAVVIQVVKQVTGCSVKDLCSNWNSNYQVLTGATGTV